MNKNVKDFFLFKKTFYRFNVLQSIISNAKTGFKSTYSVEKAEEASSAKSAFLANMSHEIRTPLGAIIGFTEILISENLRPEEKECLIENIKRNSLQLTSLIDDILDVSKIEGGKVAIQKNCINIKNIINELESSMVLRAAEKGIIFHVLNHENIPDYIITDEVRLKQILFNVIGNAIKFTDDGFVKLIFDSFKDSITGKNYIDFLIQDSGVGISELYL